MVDEQTSLPMPRKLDELTKAIAELLGILPQSPLAREDVKSRQAKKHGDDLETRGNTRSPWDSLHPVRHWATRSDNNPSPLSSKQIIEQIAEHFRKHPPKQKD